MPKMSKMFNWLNFSLRSSYLSPVTRVPLETDPIRERITMRMRSWKWECGPENENVVLRMRMWSWEWECGPGYHCNTWEKRRMRSWMCNLKAATTISLTNPHSGKQKVPVARRAITSSTRLNIRLWRPSTAQWTLFRYLKYKGIQNWKWILRWRTFGRWRCGHLTGD